MAKLIVGENDIATLFPEIAQTWHPSKNGNLTPDMFTRGSREKVWWLDNCGHEWESTISNRINGTNCPYCSNKKILADFNDLLSQYPLIAAEWNFERNTLLPSEVAPFSNKKVWWKCKLGHEYIANPNNRVHGDSCREYSSI